MVALSVEHLSKLYRLGDVGGMGTLAEDLTRTWHRLRGNEDPYIQVGEENDRAEKGTANFVWALRDVNLTVKKGEVLGIIGRNGSGKSTLLKIIGRTTAQTEGTVRIRGRVASLLEVGTGFHPDLSGRENIFLNGAILGMTTNEIKKKFDEIVGFAGVQRYIDTPVKRYSSGMYVRLAFAVAAHLEADILIVDEVLAVGDSEFQKKAFDKMREVSAGGGRTVLVVSHSMAAIENICTRAILLSNGKITESGLPRKVIAKYLHRQTADRGDLENIPDRKGNGLLKFTNASITNMSGPDPHSIETFCDIDIAVGFKLQNGAAARDVRIDVGINNNLGERVAWLSTNMLPRQPNFNLGKLTFAVANFPLSPGDYTCNLFSEIDGQVADWITYVLGFHVDEKDYYFSGKSMPENQGDVLLRYRVKEN